MKNFVSLLIVVLSFNLSQAQSSNKSANNQTQEEIVNPTKGKKAIRLLQDGTLIVRLSTFPEKIKHLEKTEGKDKAQAEQNRIDQANKDMIQEFKNDYDFSDVVFTYGTELDAYQKNKNATPFLNENLEFDPSIKIKEGPTFILSSNSTTIFKLCDSNFTPLSKPTLDYVCHHFDKDNSAGIDAPAQDFRELITDDRTAEGLNKKLHFHIRNNSLFTKN